MTDFSFLNDPDLIERLRKRRSDSQVAPPPSPADLPTEWWELWDERAAIREHDGGLPREWAEAAALGDVLQAMREAGVEWSTEQ